MYVGRGWDVSNFHVNSNVVVIFSGDYSKIHATPKQLDATQRLLALGKMKNIRTNYSLHANKNYICLSCLLVNITHVV